MTDPYANDIHAIRARHDQQQAKERSRLMSCPPQLSVLLSKPEGEAMAYLLQDQADIWPWLLRYAWLGHSATCLSVIDRADAETEAQGTNP